LKSFDKRNVSVLGKKDPPEHGRRENFLPGGTIVDFPGTTKNGEIAFHPLETNKTFFSCWECNRKMSNFKIQGHSFPLPPFWRPWSQTLRTTPLTIERWRQLVPRPGQWPTVAQRSGDAKAKRTLKVNFRDRKRSRFWVDPDDFYVKASLNKQQW